MQPEKEMKSRYRCEFRTVGGDVLSVVEVEAGDDQEAVKAAFLTQADPFPGSRIGLLEVNKIEERES